MAVVLVRHHLQTVDRRGVGDCSVQLLPLLATTQEHEKTSGRKHMGKHKY